MVSLARKSAAHSRASQDGSVSVSCCVERVRDPRGVQCHSRFVPLSGLFKAVGMWRFIPRYLRDNAKASSRIISHSVPKQIFTHP